MQYNSFDPFAGAGLGQLHRPERKFSEKKGGSVPFEAEIVGRDTLRKLPGLRDGEDVTVQILIGSFVSKFDTQRCLISNVLLLFLATCLRFE